MFQQLLSRLSNHITKLKEVTILTLFGGIPNLFGGSVLRNWIYRFIFAQVGRSAYIQSGAEFLGTNAIELGNETYIFRGARINARWGKNQVCINDQVSLQIGVDIGSMQDTRIDIGERTYIGPFVQIKGYGNIKIGKDCLIAAHTGIYANHHNFDHLFQPIRDQGVTCKGITIEDNCWLGHGVIVLDGVTIGQGSVIGANAVVTRSIPANSIAVGVPAKVIGQRHHKPQLEQSLEV